MYLYCVRCWFVRTYAPPIVEKSENTTRDRRPGGVVSNAPWKF